MTNKVLVFAGLTLAGACLLFAKVTTDYDKSADFGKYHSYSWISVKTGDPLWVDRIKEAVNSQLTAKGWQMVSTGGDAGVTAFGSTKEVPTLNTFYDGMGGGWGWRRGWGGGIGESTTTTEETPVGSLVVDIFDATTKKLIFRAQSSETLSDKPAKNEKKLDKDVADMFKKFPPPPKG